MAITIKDPSQYKTVQPAGTKPKQVGTGFTNIQRIAQAGQGSRLGQVVGGGVQAAAKGTQAGLQASQQQFGEEAAKTGLTKGTAEQEKTVGQVLQDPSKATEENIKTFEQYRAGQYKGPTQLIGADVLQQQSEQAQQLGQQLGTTGGRLALLQRFAAKPTQAYTRGQSKLDVALLGMQPQKELQAAQAAAGRLAGKVETAQAAAEQQAKEYQSRAEALKKFTEGKLGEKISGELEGEQGLEAKTAAENKLMQDAADRFQKGAASFDDLQVLGLTELAGQETYGLLPQDFSLGLDPSKAASRAQIATPEQRAKLLALGKLSGKKELTEEFGKPEEQYAYDREGRVVGKEQLKAVLKGKKQDYEKAIEPYVQTVAAGSEGIVKELARSLGVDLISPEGQSYNAAYNQDLSSLVNRYLNASEPERKIIREGVLGDKSPHYGKTKIMGRAIRDTLSSLVADYETKQQALQNINKAYNIGQRFAGTSKGMIKSSNYGR
jgi:hypothetical protein